MRHAARLRQGSKPGRLHFFAWAREEKIKLTGRGLAATAIGYALNHEEAFRRFLEDGRLLLENNRAERALRSIATARKSWLFFGSDDHASAAANLFSLVASCKLHGLDAEAYLADVIRVMPYCNRYTRTGSSAGGCERSSSRA